jgi:hypothetical protein
MTGQGLQCEQACKMPLLLTMLLSCLAHAQAQSWDQSSIIGQQFNYQLGQVFVMPTHQVRDMSLLLQL